MKYTVQLSPTGVAHVYFENKIFCSVHHMHAGGITQEVERANTIATLLNNK